jgi:hypothetical protein
VPSTDSEILLIGTNVRYSFLCNSGRHLAEICKSEYPKFVRICLWILAEVAVIAADIPEGKKQSDKQKT